LCHIIAKGKDKKKEKEANSTERIEKKPTGKKGLEEFRYRITPRGDGTLGILWYFDL
jgi:hypothetical protein